LTRYELWLLLHLLAVILWLGANTVIDLLFLRAERRRDFQELGRLGETQEWLTPRLFIPVSLATVVTGAVLVWDSFWAFDQLWVLIGLAGWLATFLNGILFLKPSGERMKRIVAADGPGSLEAQRIGARLVIVARVQLLALFLVVADMVIKPTTDDPWTLVVLAAVLVAAVVLAALALRGRTAPPSAPGVSARDSAGAV
jgi:uncharacterized membrane protein